MFNAWTDHDTHAVVMWIVFFVLLWSVAKLLSWTVFRRSGVRGRRERILKPAVRADDGMIEWTKIGEKE